MYDFILQIILFGSLGVIVYLMARAVPRVVDTGEPVHPTGRFDRMLSRLPLRQVDDRLNGYFEKFLRRVKVFILRFNNSVDAKLAKLRKMNERASETGTDLFGKGNDDKKE
ncbi:MAG: hypothetical protein AAB518_01455 [Patescibacteria group bacterium]